MENNFKVPLTRIVKIEPHPDPETTRLEIATVYGFKVVVGKGSYVEGDLAYYVAIDSVIPSWLEEVVFKDSKVKPHNGRIRQIRIRKFASSGLLINPKILPENNWSKFAKLEDDVSALLGVTKYEPVVSGPSHTLGKGKNRNKTYENKLFHKYNGLTALKWVPNIFDGEEVVIQCKLHSTNARAGILPFEANTLWKKFKKLVGLAPKYENCYGSNNVEVSAKFARKTGYYSEDVYGKAFKKINVFSKLKPNEIVFGEIIGPNIQANYTYGLSEPTFVLFDVKVLQPDGKFKWLNPEEVEAFAADRDFEFVPVLYTGMWDKDKAYSLTFGPSVYAPVQKVREGIVVKARLNYDVEGNKNAYKWVSEDYLSDKTNTDTH